MLKDFLLPPTRKTELENYRQSEHFSCYCIPFPKIALIYLEKYINELYLESNQEVNFVVRINQDNNFLHLITSEKFGNSKFIVEEVRSFKEQSEKELIADVEIIERNSRKHMGIFKLIGILIFLFTTLSCIAQTKFNDGFRVGWGKGYCYDRANCTSPNPPNPPLPKVGENIDSYQDGYNRGFTIGKSESKDGKSSNRESGYKTNSADPIEYITSSANNNNSVVTYEERNNAFNYLLGIAYKYYDKGQWQQCINYCKKAMKLCRLESSKLYYLLSLSYSNLNHSKMSKKYGKKLDIIDEKYPEQRFQIIYVPKD